MNVLQKFTYQDTPVRTIVKEGEPWFVAADVALILGLGRVHDAVRGLDDDEKGTDTVRTPGGEQQITVINEPGLYSLILRSRKPEAKAFKRWITHEVIPSIRKTGGYQVEQSFEAKTLEVMKGLTEKVESQRLELEQVKPKAEFADTFLSANGDYDTRDAAQILRRDHGIVDIGQNRLRTWMKAHGWLDRKRRPYQDKVDAGYLRLKPSSFKFTRTNGEEHLADPQVRVTPRGVEALARALKKDLIQS